MVEMVSNSLLILYYPWLNMMGSHCSIYALVYGHLHHLLGVRLLQ